ncbi:MAG TPA: hypothetical protein VI485_06665 [Vicinamibacterales bacterium]|nr:hypothetical protein [Vicinamibacterales bacterium]
MPEADRTSVRLRRARPWIVLIVATLLFVLVALYRFDALGGAFGGFDNDHFLHFAYAKQVQAGEQPLRDFQDAGLQGARPSLTYELSAAAQRYFGNNLRSEAWLTVGGVALGAAVTVVAASQIAPWPLALLMALLSALISPKLYGYPKVLVLSVASLVIVRYAARPSWTYLVVMSAWTAIAFLFRHDYAVYCGVGFGAVIAASHWTSWREGARRAVVYGVVTVALLAPSMLWVYEYRGLAEYFRNGLAMSRREGLRTDMDWPRPTLQGVSSVSSAFEPEQNTEAGLYYLFLAMPLAAIVVAWSRWRRHHLDPDGHVAALLSLGIMTALLSHYFLRGSLEGRFGDMAAPVAVIGAGLLGISLARGASSIGRRTLRASAALAVLAFAAACIWSLQQVGAELRTTRLLQSPGDQTRRISEELASLPVALRESQATTRMEAADYLHRCTRPTDRVFVVGYEPELFVFAERLFAAGRATVIPEFYADERYSREAIAGLESQSVPIVLAEPETFYATFPALLAYLRTRYAEHGTVRVNEVGSLRVLVRKDASGRPTGPRGLPCFG